MACSIYHIIPPYAESNELTSKHNICLAYLALSTSSLAILLSSYFLIKCSLSYICSSVVLYGTADIYLIVSSLADIIRLILGSKVISYLTNAEVLVVLVAPYYSIVYNFLCILFFVAAFLLLFINNS